LTFYKFKVQNENFFRVMINKNSKENFLGGILLWNSERKWTLKEKNMKFRFANFYEKANRSPYENFIFWIHLWVNFVGKFFLWIIENISVKSVIFEPQKDWKIYQGSWTSLFWRLKPIFKGFQKKKKRLISINKIQFFFFRVRNIEYFL